VDLQSGRKQKKLKQRGKQHIGVVFFDVEKDQTPDLARLETTRSYD